jgi:hypothetical protein
VSSVCCPFSLSKERADIHDVCYDIGVVLLTYRVLHFIFNYLTKSILNALSRNSMLIQPINKLLTRMESSIVVFSRASLAVIIAKLFKLFHFVT